MTSVCLSAPPRLLLLFSLKPGPTKPNSTPTGFSQISFRNSVSFSLPFKPLPLRRSLNPPRRFSTCASLSSSSSSSSNDKTNEPIWKSFGKSIENFGKKPSVEELLRQQIEKQEYYDEGGGSGNSPGGRGGGGGGGDGVGGSGDEGFSEIVDETIQVILATLGFIFMYIYIINGAEMTRLAKDYISYLFGGRKSARLSKVLYQWERFCKNLNKKEEVDPFWLEKAIVTTPTWWDSPDKYMQLLKAVYPVQPKSDANEKHNDDYGSQTNEEMSDEYY